MNNGIIITNANKLTEAIKAAEVRMGIPRKHMDGVTISVDMNAQKFPSSISG